jgi:DNA invertase Pin-like site-specific DNA recombinase
MKIQRTMKHQAPKTKRAATYTCLSSKHPQFSIAWQIAEIRKYAKQHGVVIARLYSDEAKGGGKQSKDVPNPELPADDNPDAGLNSAAVYVRMSTEHQQYSTSDQIAAIRKYAKQHGLKIVSTSSDGAKGGGKQ